MIISLKTVQICKQKKEPEQIQQMYNLDEDQTTLKVLATDTYDILIRTNSDDAIVDVFKLVDGKNGSTTFLPLNTKTGGPVQYVKDK